MKVAILGAGVAGLSAADALRRKGCDTVTVYEALDRVGGKVNTHWVDERPYELGAFITLNTDEVVAAQRERHDVQVVPALERKVYDLETNTVLEFADWQKKQHSTVATLAGMARHWKNIHDNDEIYEPGNYDDADPDLFMGTLEYVERKKLEAIAWLYEPIQAGLGYGYYAETPALYTMRFIDREKLAVLLKTLFNRDPKVFIFPYGFQSLWQSVAKGLDVRLNCPVSKIERRDGQVFVTAQGKTEQYDRIILTPSTAKVLDLLDASDDEREIYGKLRFNPYLTTVFRASGLAQNETVYIGQHRLPETRGRMMVYSHPHGDRNVYLGWQYGHEGQADDLARWLQEDVERMGGTFEGIVKQKFWPTYFPHVGEEDLKAGYFEKLDAMQGVNQTYYAGSMVDYETTGNVSAWGEALVERFF